MRVAVVSAVVDGGMAKSDAMRELGIMSISPLQRWYKLYLEGGAEALRPRPKGRLRVSGEESSRGRAPASRSSRSAAEGSRPRWPT